MNSGELVELFWNRQESAISETEREYGRYCFCVANNLLHNSQDAEECVNDTYLRVWNSIPPQRPTDFKAFLARITRNLAIDRLRAKNTKKRSAVIVAFAELENELYENGDFSDGITLDALQKSLDHFLRLIPERDRNVFIRRYWFGEDIAVIAKKYGLREDHVFKILSRVRQRLKKHLTKEGYYQ